MGQPIPSSPVPPDRPLTVEPAPADTFSESGMRMHFRGPYADGPPASALKVEAPDINRFGLHELRRMLVIVVVFVVRLAAAAAGRLTRRRRGSWPSALSNGLVDAFEELGPSFVKLGQMIASAPSVFPQPLADACVRCLDEVAPFDPAIACRMVEEDLGHSVSSLFRSFDSRPLSAASIAQVHCCVLPDGRQAVIKLQRPDIFRRMNTDLRITYRLARLIERHPKVEKLNLVGAVVDLHRVTNEELNFALEAHRQHRFRSNIGAFGDNENVTAPEVYWEYCGPRMICMERMFGVPLDDFETLREWGIDGETVLRQGLKVWMEAVMVHGPFHGDVHAGNLWVLEDGRSSLLDFGIMGELDETWRALFRDMQYTAMIDGDYSRVVRNWKKVGVFSEDVGSDEEVGAFIKMAMDPLLDRSIAEVSLGELMKTNLDLAEQFGAKAPRELSLLSKQLIYFERYARELAPDYNMSRDLYLVKNIFPEAVAARAAELGVTLPR